MREKCKRLYAKEKGRLLPEKRERNKEKVWSDCCKLEIRKDGWQDHLATYKHKHYKEMEEGDVMRQEGKVWCETCRILPYFFKLFFETPGKCSRGNWMEKGCQPVHGRRVELQEKNGRTC